MEEEQKHGEQKAGEDQQLVFMEEGRRAQQELVETEQTEESQVKLPLQPSPPPPPPRANEGGLKEQVVVVEQQEGFESGDEVMEKPA